MDNKQKASLFAVLSASALALSKFAAGIMSGSMAVTSSGLDSLLDVFMSAINFFAIRKAAQPADESHPYGHGKAEDIAAVIQSFVIIFSGVVIVHKTWERFFSNTTISYSSLDFGVMLLSLTGSFAISRVLLTVGRRTGSNTLKADALHYTSDLYSNSAALVAIILAFYTGMTYIDHIFAVIVAAIIIFSALRIMREGISGLMDSSIPVYVEKEIERIIDAMPYPYAGFHKLRSRTSGTRKYMDFHLLTCRGATIDEAHALAHKVEREIESTVAAIDVVIHIEPCAYQCAMDEDTCVILKMRATRK